MQRKVSFTLHPTIFITDYRNEDEIQLSICFSKITERSCNNSWIIKWTEASIWKQRLFVLAAMVELIATSLAFWNDKTNQGERETRPKPKTGKREGHSRSFDMFSESGNRYCSSLESGILKWQIRHVFARGKGSTDLIYKVFHGFAPQQNH